MRKLTGSKAAEMLIFNTLVNINATTIGLCTISFGASTVANTTGN